MHRDAQSVQILRNYLEGAGEEIAYFVERTAGAPAGTAAEGRLGGDNGGFVNRASMRPMLVALHFGADDWGGTLFERMSTRPPTT
jgi:hypothetical protein